MTKMKKSKFRPRISRVKLNAEQAVLSCGCYVQSGTWWDGTPAGNTYNPSSYAGNDLVVVDQSDASATPACSGPKTLFYVRIISVEEQIAKMGTGSRGTYTALS